MQFVVTPPERLTEAMLQQAYLSGVDRAAWPVRTSARHGVLALERSVGDSANLHVPWHVEGHGWVTLSTASLREQPEPYQLPLELARGTVGQLRNQLSEWQVIGLAVPEAVQAKVNEATDRFSRAVVLQDDPPASARGAEEALLAALDAAQLLAACYAEQALASRRRGGARLGSLLGADLGTSLLDDYTSRQFLAAFNAAAVPLLWRDVEAAEGSFRFAIPDKQIEWCRMHGLKVCAGPLLLLDPRALPDWIYLWQDDFDNLLACAGEFLRAVVSRYRGKVDYWVCAGRVNTAEVLALSEEEKLRLAAAAVETVRSLDPDTPAMVSIDQPWAEYMSRRPVDFSPLYFTDTLVRAGLELQGVMVEMNLGYHPGGTLLRTPLELSRQLDCFAALGLPLLISLSAPSACHDDPLAARRVQLAPGGWTPQAQQTWVARHVPLILAKPAVQGVLWNQLRDSEPHDFPHAGLFDDRRHAKPALRTLAALRQACLK